jgi:hypothetical protein
MLEAIAKMAARPVAEVARLGSLILGHFALFELQREPTTAVEPFGFTRGE